jgi:Tfp pilus assembly protein PilN
MLKLNLLPWREQQRIKQKRIFKSILIIMLIFVLMLWIILHISMNRSIQQALFIDYSLKQKITHLDKQIAELTQ